MADTLTITQVGPQSHGSRMSLDEFARAEGQPGHLYELHKGVIEVVDVPGLPHGLVLQVIREELGAYRRSHPGAIYYVAAGSDAALRMPDLQSERHPDLAVYLTRPPVAGEQPWEYWTPDIVVEVVSPSSEQRDYQIKRDEYLKAGVKLYWIVDPTSRSATVLTRRTDTWSAQRLTATGRLVTPLLPQFELQLADLFAALPS